MRITCCVYRPPCQRLARHHCSAPALPRILRSAIGELVSTTSWRGWDSAGLGAMAVKIARALGTEVTVMSTSEGKRKDAERLGATNFAVTSNPQTFTKLQRHFDYVLDTVSAPHDYNAYLKLLKTDGTMILVGAPEQPTLLAPFPLILNRRRLAGSVIGSIRETQEMLDFCAEHKIESDVEVIAIQQVNEAYERVLKGDVRFRFVIDMDSLA